MEKIYSRINWQNYPNTSSPINESNLNKMDKAINDLDDRIIVQNATKLDVATANTMVNSITFDEETGIFTITYLSGSIATIDTKLEKLAVNFSYDQSTNQLVITLDDGTVQYVDLSSLITTYNFEDTDTIAFEIVNGTVKAVVKNGSITEEKLEPNYLANVQLATQQAQSAASNASTSESQASGSALDASSKATLSESYAKGGTGTRDGEDADNAKYYMEQAKNQSVVPTKVSQLENDTGFIAGDGDGSRLTETFTEASALENINSLETNGTIFGKVKKAISSIISHLENSENPHGVTKSQVGLGSVDNTSDADKPVSTAQASAINAVVDNLGTEVTRATTAENALNNNLTSHVSNHGYAYKILKSGKRPYAISESANDVINFSTRGCQRNTSEKAIICKGTNGTHIFWIIIGTTKTSVETTPLTEYGNTNYKGTLKTPAGNTVHWSIMAYMWSNANISKLIATVSGTDYVIDVITYDTVSSGVNDFILSIADTELFYNDSDIDWKQNSATEEEINEINTVSISQLSNINVNFNDYSLAKVGKIVNFSFQINGSEMTPCVWVVIGNVGEGFRPCKISYGSVTNPFGNMGIINITRGGDIQLYVQTSSQYYCANLTWFTE